jgi:hypothetical protein
LGAQPLSEGLSEIANFLENHPREVVLIIFEDGISVERTRAALDVAGLLGQAWAWTGQSQLPTLGELIEGDTRLILSLESGNVGEARLASAWSLFSDTPYSFASPSEFSCELNRGEAGNPLFLMNHWISNPLPDAEAAAEVNAEEFLLARALECAESRGRMANFLGVDFYDLGGVVAVAEHLNLAGGPE